MYDDKTEKFGFKFATKMSYGYILQSDKTAEYQQRYPDAGITEVKVNHIWKDNGIILLGGLTFWSIKKEIDKWNYYFWYSVYLQSVAQTKTN
mgnify:CR=1 FL=1